MLNLNNLPSESQGELVRAVPVRRKDSEGLMWDLDFKYALTAESFPAIDEVFPVASQMIQTEDEGPNTLRNTKKRDEVLLRCSLQHDDGAIEPLSEMRASIKFTKLIISGKLAVAVIRMRARGTAVSRARLVDQLGDQVETRIERLQQSLFDKKADTPKVDKLEPGQIATVRMDDELIVGQLAKVTKKLVHIEGLMGGGPTKYGREHVTSAVTLNTPQGTSLPGAVATIRKRAQRRGKQPNWSDVLHAVAAAGDNGLNLVTNDIIDDVIERADPIPASAELPPPA